MNKRDREIIVELFRNQSKQMKLLDDKIKAIDKFTEKLFNFIIRRR